MGSVGARKMEWLMPVLGIAGIAFMVYVLIVVMRRKGPEPPPRRPPDPPQDPPLGPPPPKGGGPPLLLEPWTFIAHKMRVIPKRKKVKRKVDA